MAPTRQPLTVVIQPGQELRIVAPDRTPGFARWAGDSRASPSGSGDSRASPSGSGDSRASPSGSGDATGRDAFGFSAYRRGFGPSVVTLVAEPGQEIRVVVADSGGDIPLPRADSRASPSGSGDSGRGA